MSTELQVEHQWFILAAFPLLVRHFGDECLVFHTGAADTFVVDAFAGLLLEHLAIHPSSSAALAQQFAKALDVPCDHAFMEQVTAQLSDLHGLGLIECRTLS